MESTLRQALKSRKVRDVKGYYSYEHIVNSINVVFKNIIDFSVEEIVTVGIKCFTKGLGGNPSGIDSSINVPPSALLDFLLVDTVRNVSDYPIFIVNHELCNSLYKTSTANKDLVISNPFSYSGIVLMPKILNGNKPSTAIYVFRTIEFNDNSMCVAVLCLHQHIGVRSNSFFWINKKNNNLNERNKVDFLFNLFLYKESVENTATETELVIPQSRGFGTAKNTNQKQIIIPRMIGADYKPKTIRQESTGTHASPTTHWRSGHWRQQLIGKKENPDHKTIWIEPVLVNG
jgi:hypothetical protein